VPPFAASGAIVFIFRDLIAKSAEQQGQPIPRITHLEGLKEGLKAAPTIGTIIGAQMGIQGILEKAFAGNANQGTLSSMLASSATVGAISAPIIAVFNGQTMGWSIKKSLQKFSAKQAGAIAAQETAFVAGLSAADRLSALMRQEFGDNRMVGYAAAFTAGFVGSFAGHPANTALTRWQSGLSIDSHHQLMWGSTRRARAIGFFSVGYTVIKEALHPKEPCAFF
jgi:hypothetical protein